MTIALALGLIARLRFVSLSASAAAAGPLLIVVSLLSTCVRSSMSQLDRLLDGEMSICSPLNCVAVLMLVTAALVLVLVLNYLSMCASHRCSGWL
jgi:hypothetical protein